MSDQKSINDAKEPGCPGECLRQHPRINRLRERVAALPVGQEYRDRLLHSIDLYADHIVTRPVYAPEEGWDDLEALQQVALGDWMEEMLRERFRSEFQQGKG